MPVLGTACARARRLRNRGRSDRCSRRFWRWSFDSQGGDVHLNARGLPRPLECKRLLPRFVATVVVFGGKPLKYWCSRGDSNRAKLVISSATFRAFHDDSSGLDTWFGGRGTKLHHAARNGKRCRVFGNGCGNGCHTIATSSVAALRIHKSDSDFEDERDTGTVERSTG